MTERNIEILIERAKLSVDAYTHIVKGYEILDLLELPWGADIKNKLTTFSEDLETREEYLKLLLER